MCKVIHGSMDHLSGVESLKKRLSFPQPSVGLCKPFSISATIWVGLILCGSCECSHCHCGCLCTTALHSWHLENTVLGQSPIISASYDLPAPLFRNDPWALRGEGVTSISHLGPSTPQSFILCTLIRRVSLYQSRSAAHGSSLIRVHQLVTCIKGRTLWYINYVSIFKRY